ncbi:formimidoyltransferase-cyclodeaminase-like isoform X2 [Halichondria panicea]|uniref:formimidoyltransferase-cyclodeaminase-like isoform X2 n=1 Tax=Halichondria panicea TaxID=6063 RepID=UPI00312B35C8
MSSARVVECVPNFSEGRNEETIQAIASAIKSTEGCSLLDVEPGVSINRTVYTFVGSPESVVMGALSAAKVAYKLIDMTKHHGAMDVCPFVPVANTTLEDCVRCSKSLGEQLARELGVPVYLYEASQERDYRRSLQSIRKGEYEELQEKLKQADWAPDYGPTTFVPRWGVSVVGARKFLIAYNVNLLGTKEQANRISIALRESGGSTGKKPGRLKLVRALGWYVAEQGIAQVSMNLCDYEVTPIHTAFEECSKDARELKLGVVGSEIVGLVPLKPILMAADYYIEKEGLFVLHESQKVRLVIDRLGLNSISEFKPQEKIIEYRVGSNTDGPLASGSVRSFVEQLAARTSAPGGGSASACIASMGAALGAMVGLLTFGNRKFEALDPVMRVAIPPLHSATQQLIPLIDKDTQAFSSYMEALKLPKTTKEEIAKRKQAMQDGLKDAIEVPLNVMKIAYGCWDYMITIATHGNETALSDIQVGGCSLHTGLKGAYYNVCINLKQVTDEDYVRTVREEVERMSQSSEDKLTLLLDTVKQRQNKGQ